MNIQGLFCVVLSVVPIAASVLGLGGSHTRLNIVARGGDEVPQAHPNPSHPQFVEYQGPPLRLDSENTLKSVARHYNVYEPWDDPSSPPDAGLRAAAILDTRSGTIAFEFTTLEIGSGLSENGFLMVPGGFVYRIRRYDGTEKPDLLLILPQLRDEYQQFAALKSGEAQLLEYMMKISRPDLHPAEMRQLILDIAGGMQSFAPYITARMALWMRTQMSGALNRLIESENGKQAISQSSVHLRRKEKRANPIVIINSQENQSSQNSTANLRAEFLQYQDAFDALQSNISYALFPVLNELIAGSNNSIVYQMALSIYSDITLSKQQVIGPFSNGMTAFTWLEDRYMNNTNTTIETGRNGTLLVGPNRVGVALMMAAHSAYEQLYLSTWDKAIKVTNSTGSLSKLSALAANLLPKDASIYPPDWLNGTQSFLDSGDFQALARFANFSSSGRAKPSR